LNTDQARTVLVSDFNVENFAMLLAKQSIDSVIAPFGQVMQTLFDPNAECWQEPCGAAFVWTRAEDLFESFGRLMDGERVELDSILNEVDAFCDAVLGLGERVPLVLVSSWVWPPERQGDAILSARSGVGGAAALYEMNALLARRVAEAGNVYLLDAQRWIAQAGDQAFSPKLWYMAKVPYGKAVFKAAARDLVDAITTLRGGARKLVILDLDDTLWGGIVGEIGWEKVKLGGHDPVGEAFVHFQRELKALTRRGIILGIVSKNEESTALDAIDQHPEMVLRRDDFSGWRINWSDKAQNVIELTEELNLGFQSVVFIDDNPAERLRVSEALPEVLVPDWPKDKLLYASALLGMSCFDSPGVSDEDRKRTAMYGAERERRDGQQSARSLDDWVASLELSVTAERLNEANLPRAAQLLNKTNQMNMATRRMSEAELWTWSQAQENAIWSFRVDDRFGSAGLTGLAGIELRDGVAHVTDYLLSCRVMGRRVEETMLHTIIEHARAEGVTEVVFTFLPTEKNAPCLRWLQGSALIARGDSEFVWDVADKNEAPKHVTIVTDDTGAK